MVRLLALAAASMIALGAYAVAAGQDDSPKPMAMGRGSEEMQRFMGSERMP